MRHKASHQKDEASVDLTPMLDIVFIMLIFFIVTATFLKEAGLDVTKPETPPEDLPQKTTQPFRIIVTDTDRILIKMRDVDPRAVRANVERLRAESPDAPVLVQSDRQANTGVVIRTMDQAREAGAAQVSIAAIDD